MTTNTDSNNLLDVGIDLLGNNTGGTNPADAGVNDLLGGTSNMMQDNN